MKKSIDNGIGAVVFDYGGVLAEEGFKEGLMAIGRQNGLQPEDFFARAADAVYDSGYVTGQAKESVYWEMLRKGSRIIGPDEDLRKEILTRFTLRPPMIELVRQLRNRGLTVAILSDQTDWLDELEERDDFFKEFQYVFNSFHLGKGKRDASVFTDIANKLGIEPGRIVFVDDNPGHVERARNQGLIAVLFRDKDGLLSRLKNMGLVE